MQIRFSGIEADALRHRLTYLADMEADELADLFPDYDAPEALAELADHAAAQLYDGMLHVTVADVGTLLVLEDAVEGATIHELAEEGREAGRITRQKAAAYKSALKTAGEKIARARQDWDRAH